MIVGYLCPAGSESQTATFCKIGSYCPGGLISAIDILCPAGTYGSTIMLKNATCSGLCQEGIEL